MTYMVFMVTTRAQFVSSVCGCFSLPVGNGFFSELGDGGNFLMTLPASPHRRLDRPTPKPPVFLVKQSQLIEAFAVC